MKKPLKKSISMLIVLLLALCGVPSALATNESDEVLTCEKEEIVYATLDANGAVQAVYVVNAFEVPEDGIIEDYGTYTKATNLTNTDALVQQGEVVRVHTSAGRFYYQGDLAQAELPWLVEIEYLLDGNEINPEELGGKSGSLEIRLRFAKNPAGNALFADNYLLQATVTLDMDVCSNIDARGAMAANSGADKTLAYMLLPGQEKEFTISTDVENFSMSGIQIAALPLALSIDRPDTSSFAEQLTALQDGIRQLADGASELDDGLSQLANGADGLSNGGAELAQGLRRLDGQSDALVDGSAQVLAGLEQLSALLHGQTTVTAGQTGGSALEVIAGLRQLQEGIQSVADAQNTLSESVAASREALVQRLASLPSGGGADDAVAALADTEDPNVQALLAAYARQKQALAGIQDLASELQALLTGLESGMKNLAGQLQTMADSLGTLSDSISNETLSSLAPLIEAVDTLAQSYQGLHEGLTQYTQGVSSVSSGYAKLLMGMQELESGLEQTADGSQQLAEGTGELRTETADMDTLIDEEIDKLLAEYNKEDFEPVSFVSEKNTQVSAVQFVLQTEAIAAPEEAAAALDEQPDRSFWERLIALFGG